MKQMEVTIMGQSYLLGCPDGGEAALTKAVAQVDKEMCAIRDAGRVKARERIAVLAALNLAFDVSDRTASPAAGFAPSELPLVNGNGHANGNGNGSGAHDPRLANLLQRLDTALGDDGRLL